MPGMETLRIGSRGSKLALWQAEWVKARLAEAGHLAEIVIIKTTGDRILDVPLARIGGKGLFTKEIEEALIDGRVDLAVHSLKDLPTTLPEGLIMAAMPQREDPRDVLVGGTLEGLPDGASVGTGSLRRTAQLRALRPGLVVADIRGNVDTRLRKHKEGQYEALVMASAGLTRLGLQAEICEYLAPEIFLPAVAQGALAIETRADEGPGWHAAKALHDFQAAATVEAERALLAGLGGGCQVPVGAYATIEGHRLLLRAVVVSPDGLRLVRREREGTVTGAAQVGMRLAEELMASEARDIIAAAQTAPTAEHD
ncbi:MAG: hydroxymethylbilane synthase [Bryobacterales bacterium]|nr:hydroxymethylbilane synthase [Bryobacterales bacterium]